MDLPIQDAPVTLVIKAPNQRMGDLTVDCMLGWTIQKLKQHLEAVYPSKPKQNEQRLIYSGKLLQDHLTLKEILHQFDAEDASNKHTVHLVCSNTKANGSLSSSSQKAKEDRSLSQSSSTTTALSPSQSETHTPVTSIETSAISEHGDGLRFRGHVSNAPTNAESPSPSQMPFSQVPPNYPYSPEQYTWMMQQQQQFYAQYMMQYMQYYQGMYGAGQPFAAGGVMPPSPFGMPPTSSAQFFSQPQPQAQQPNQQPANQHQAQQPAAAGDNNNAPRQNMRMNAQGGMEEDDEDEGDPRDWLHHTYFLMRLLTFLGILFFYSSISRFLMVFAGSFAIYFFQKLRKYMQRVQRDRERQQEQSQQEQQQQQEDNGEQQEQPPAAEQPANPITEEANEDQAATEQPTTENEAVPEVPEGNRVKRLCLFISRTIQIFFTSLVPAPAELLEGN